MLVRPAGSATILPTYDTLTAPPPAPKPRAGTVALDRLELPTGIAGLGAVAPKKPADPRSLAGLPTLIADAQVAALAGGDGPPDPATFASLRSRVEKARAGLPPAYQRAVVDPLLATLDRLGPSGYARVLAEDPDRVGEAALLLDVAQAVLQRSEGYQARATAAFQEVVSDLYDGFLSEEDRRGVKPPDHGVAAPLVRWGRADTGPYTWPATATAFLDVQAAVVSLPAPNASGGLLAWPALAHETAGHDLLEADAGLRDELAGVVRGHLRAEELGVVADYFADRIDESAADVLGVLNMGPAAAVGLVGYFRALNGASGGSPSLRTAGPEEDSHPADLVRAYLAAETVRLLSFDGAAAWADRLVAEADRDLGRIRLGGVNVTPGVAKEAAAVVAKAIVRTKLAALDGHALGEIQDWRNEDERIVAALRARIAGKEGAAATAGTYVKGAYAAHAVAAGVYETVAGSTRPAEVMPRMIEVLADMHARNPSWGSAPGTPPSAAERRRGTSS
ncbi:MAG TPA: hypothetical protein VEB43_05860 [Anaeromyxobacter sp.]|nr:hypothetical protein [Anaeromyxobacter sp.]